MLLDEIGLSDPAKELTFEVPDVPKNACVPRETSRYERLLAKVSKALIHMKKLPSFSILLFTVWKVSGANWWQGITKILAVTKKRLKNNRSAVFLDGVDGRRRDGVLLLVRL